MPALAHAYLVSWPKILLFFLVSVLIAIVITGSYVIWHRFQIGLDQRVAPVLTLPTQPLYESPYYLEPLPSPKGLDRIVCLNPWADGSVLISQQNGMLWHLDLDESASSRVVLDLSQKTFGGGESGLFGVVAHPDFNQPDSRGFRKLFVFYCAKRSIGSNSNRLSRFTWNDKLRVIDPDSEQILIEQTDEDSWHNGGAMVFGSDGFLYLTVGDEGGPNDPFENTQRIDRDLFSGVLRIDVDEQGGSVSHPITRQPQSGTTAHYFIPNDNPWVGTPNALEEFYAIGLRSPHNLFIDPITKEIYLTDVGQNTREELNRLRKGANYGWSYLEGDITFDRSRFNGVAPTPVLGTNATPMFTYAHSNGNNCIIGGTVYQGQKFPELAGRILVGDLGSGRIWSLASASPQATQPQILTTLESKQSRSLVGIATTGSGDVIVASLSGGLYTLRHRKAVDRSHLLPQKLSETGLFTDLKSLTPAPGIVPYEVNSPLWSDGAQKQRWLAIPGDGKATNPTTDRIIIGSDGSWSFPVGSTFIKHFSLPIDHQNPAVEKRLETRVLVRDSTGSVWGVTYRWNDDDSEALLLPQEGLTEQIAIRHAPAGEERVTWTYPGRDACLTCHNSAAGGVLGLSTVQLNRRTHYQHTERTGDQLRTLNEIGYFSRDRTRIKPIRIHSFLRLDSLASPSDTTESLHDRVDAYFSANCAHCHRPGYLRIDMDLRHGVPMKDRAILDVKAEVPTASLASKRIDVTNPELSEIYARMKRLEPGIRMPLIGSQVVDQQGTQLILEWINQLPRIPKDQ